MTVSFGNNLICLWVPFAIRDKAAIGSPCLLYTSLAKRKQILHHHLEIEIPDYIFDELLELLNEGK